MVSRTAASGHYGSLTALPLSSRQWKNSQRRNGLTTPAPMAQAFHCSVSTCRAQEAADCLWDCRAPPVLSLASKIDLRHAE